jgi:hypothetical protein
MYLNKYSDHVELLAIEDLDIFCQDVSGYSCT